MSSRKEQLVKNLECLAERAKQWPSLEEESPESAHIKADYALLEYIGDKEITEAFHRIEKWYA